MYKQIDVVGDAESRARAKALEDRMVFLPFMEAAEKYAASHEIFVGGASATRLLLGPPDMPPPVGLDSFQYEFYSGRAVQQARELGDIMYKLAPQGLGHYVTVLTKVTGHHIMVSVDGRDLFSVMSLPMHRGIRVADVVIPSLRPAQFARSGGTPLQLQCMGPEIQLMRIYAALCDPGQAGEWGKFIATESTLRDIFEKEIREKITKAVHRVGGGRSVRRTDLFHALRNEYVTGPGRVLIGPVALAVLRKTKEEDTLRLQVVATGSLESEAREISLLAKRIGIEVHSSTNDPKIPTDSRLRRLTISIVDRDRREPVLDVYNAAAHELVPYTVRDRDATKVGTPFVLLRFRLADMWTMQVLMQMKAVNSNYAKGVLHEMLGDYESIVEYYETVLQRAVTEPEEVASLLTPLADYIGRLENPELALKREAASRVGTRFFPPYLPAQKDAGSDTTAGAIEDTD